MTKFRFRITFIVEAIEFFANPKHTTFGLIKIEMIDYGMNHEKQFFYLI